MLRRRKSTQLAPCAAYPSAGAGLFTTGGSGQRGYAVPCRLCRRSGGRPWPAATRRGAMHRRRCWRIQVWPRRCARLEAPVQHLADGLARTALMRFVRMLPAIFEDPSDVTGVMIGHGAVLLPATGTFLATQCQRGVHDAIPMRDFTRTSGCSQVLARAATADRSRYHCNIRGSQCFRRRFRWCHVFEVASWSCHRDGMARLLRAEGAMAGPAATKRCSAAAMVASDHREADTDTYRTLHARLGSATSTAHGLASPWR